MFSDSILFVSKGNSEHDLDKIAYITSYLLNSLFSANVPVKGALAYGLFTANFGSSKFFGRPLVDAYLLAEEVHFYGAVLHHSFEKHLRDTGRELPNQILKRKKLPMKGGPVVHSFIDWRHFREEHEASTDSVISNFYSSVSGSTRRYVDNTLNAYCEEALRNDHHD